MNNFWSNVYKFPRFFISFILGFFLIILRPILKASKTNQSIIQITAIVNIIIYAIYIILKNMLDIN